jgi:hypothetical protein
MQIFLEGRRVDLSGSEYFGGKTDGYSNQDLYRLSDGSWLLHTRHFAQMIAPALCTLSEDDAVGWLLELRQSQASAGPAIRGQWRARQTVPDTLVGRDVSYTEYHRSGKEITSGPPPINEQVELQLPEGSPALARIAERQTKLLEPGRVLDHIMHPPAAETQATSAFRDQRHDPMLARLLVALQSALFERPQITIIQNRQDHGCDLIIEWPMRAKYGVQLKSNGDVEEKEFARNTMQQIQDSRTHGLKKLFVVLAADITGKSNLEKVRALMSRISAMNDPYISVVPPENAFNLLFPQ